MNRVRGQGGRFAAAPKQQNDIKAETYNESQS